MRQWPTIRRKRNDVKFSTLNKGREFDMKGRELATKNPCLSIADGQGNVLYELLFSNVAAKVHKKRESQTRPSLLNFSLTALEMNSDRFL